MLLALPILLPLGTAIALHLLPQRSRLLRVVAFVGALLILAAAVAILVRVQCRRHSGAPGRLMAGAVRHHAGRRSLQRADGGDGRHHWRGGDGLVVRRCRSAA